MARNRFLARFGQLAFFLALLVGPAGADEPSICYGTTSDGRLEYGWQLPGQGSNFLAYSTLGQVLGRNYVHSAVHAVILDAYAETAKTMPETVFVYGETGFREGGEFKPHKTHRNGLSVDFMVPIRDGNDRSVPLPTNVLNKWGYDLEFDGSGRLDDWHIDFIAMAEHLYQLDQVARRHGAGIWRVIFDPELQPMLEVSPHWEYLKQNLQFSNKRSWVRHDEHYHVDFELACKPAA